MKHIKTFFSGWLLFHFIWMAGSFLFCSRTLPSPVAVYQELFHIFFPSILIHAGASLLRILGGLFLSVLFGAFFGLLMGLSKRWNRLLHSLVYFSYSVPKTALLPVFMLLLGAGEGSKLLLLTLAAVFQVLVAVRDAAAGIEPSCYHVAKSAGASSSSLLFHITLPAILPALFTSLRVGTGTSLAILILAEAYGTRWGIGYFILDAWSRINYVQMYGGIAVLALMGGLLFLLLDALSGWLCRWK